ncbi:GntR family transcriptional regulator [Aestuariicoccus sp. MJ-SS9]|uniref:GntR family transcriptional regulator n=1 Tax=Aestuariicoccus sp. MJ-SS9 TaxID=3079855 RepID=UPI002915AACF|nr:GntR family transcriptional regulator [Aestuariicoccus sp. MJ-SS9]MDU8909800.1 GntR family transcriptional regulator [Aestuariicoccus sp. MJ-SS9]
MPTSAKDLCFEDLRSRILSTDLEPGSDLDESSLAERYGISRTPLREVLQRLAGQGFVQITGNRGAKVASMDIGTMRTFFQTAPMVYANVARLAAENRTTAQLDALKAAQRAFAAATRAADPNQIALANHRFHAITVDMASNPYLAAAMERLLIDHTRLSQTFYRPASDTEKALIAKASEQHDAIIAAIEAREGALAIELTLQHWDLSRDRLERFVRPDPLPVDVLSFKDRKHAL